MVPNPNQLTAQLRMMPDQELLKYAQLHKEDPYVFPMIVAEDTARKQMRMQMQAKAYRPQPTIADQALMAMAAPQQPPQMQPQMQPQMPPQAPQAQSAGISGLQAPNMQNMADGGIAGYDDSTESTVMDGGFHSHNVSMTPGMLDFSRRSEPVVRMADGGKPPSGFDSAVDFVLNMEGGQYVENDAGKGPSRWGILQIANPNVDVKNLSKEDAKKIYKAKYWDPIKGDELSSQNPGLALATFDAAVNHGVPTARNMLASSQGDVGNLLQQRSNLYKDLINKDPQTYAKYGPSWDNRLNNLSAKIFTAVPTTVSTSALTGEALSKARAGAIPGSPLQVGDKQYTYEGIPLPPKTPESSIGQKAVGTGETALSLLTGLAAVPMAGALQAKDVIGYGLDRLMGRPGQEPTEAGFEIGRAHV